MRAYDIGVKLALDEVGLGKLAESISQMKDKAFAKHSPKPKMHMGPGALDSPRGKPQRAAAPAPQAAAPAPAPQRAAQAPARPTAPKKNLLQQTGGNIAKNRRALQMISGI